MSKRRVKKGYIRQITTIPVEVHEAIKRIAYERTRENGGAVQYTISDICREAMFQKIEWERGKEFLNEIRRELVLRGKIDDPLMEEEIRSEVEKALLHSHPDQEIQKALADRGLMEEIWREVKERIREIEQHRNEETVKPRSWQEIVEDVQWELEDRIRRKKK